MPTRYRLKNDTVLSCCSTFVPESVKAVEVIVSFLPGGMSAKFADWHNISSMPYKLTDMLRSIVRATTLLFAGAVLLSSCSSSKKTGTVSRNAVKGTWTLDQISYEGLASSERLRLTLLDEGSETCLKGSTWVLPNNGYGSFTISQNQQGCLPGQKNIVWSYRTEADQPIFQFKKLEGGVKAKDIEEGYRFKVLSADDASMVLQSQISYQGKPIYINYSFRK
jgi:hypothetical protein